MNFYQSANIGLSAAVVSGIVGGLAGFFGAHAAAGDTIHIIVANGVALGLLLFILLLRLKMAIDDDIYFKDRDKLPSIPETIGFILAALTAVALAVAAYQIANPVNSAELVVIGIVVSTVWIAVHLLEITLDDNLRRTETYVLALREKWIIFNCVYVLLLSVFIGWFPMIVHGGNAIPLYLLYVVLAFDWLTSRQTKSASEVQGPTPR